MTPRCPFCASHHHARLIDCPNIDAAQLVEALRRDRTFTAHRAADPHCTCPDCVTYHAAMLDAAEGGVR